MNEKIKNVVEEYAVMLYDRKEIHNTPIYDIQFTVSNQLFLDVLLMKIRSKTIAYATMGKTQNPRRRLEENINFSKRKYREQIKKRKKN